MLFNLDFHTYHCLRYTYKLHLNILIFHGDTKGDTVLPGHTDIDVYKL